MGRFPRGRRGDASVGGRGPEVARVLTLEGEGIENESEPEAGMRARRAPALPIGGFVPPAMLRPSYGFEHPRHSTSVRRNSADSANFGHVVARGESDGNVVTRGRLKTLVASVVAVGRCPRTKSPGPRLSNKQSLLCFGSWPPAGREGHA